MIGIKEFLETATKKHQKSIPDLTIKQKKSSAIQKIVLQYIKLFKQIGATL